jgi:hypothetical protein
MPSTSLLSFVALLVAGSALSVRAQDTVEWSTETRTSLSFRVREAAVRPLLPEGWRARPAAGADDSATVTVTMMERLLVLDGQGNPVRTGMTRYVVLSVAAEEAASGRTGTLIVAGISPEGAGAYGVYQTATTARVERSSSGEAEDGGQAQESWEFAAVNGDRLSLRVRYRRARPTRATSVATLRSGARPDFTRTYRINQATDVLRGANATADRVDEIEFRATGPRLAPLFDGSETLLTVTSIPWYLREISVP